MALERVAALAIAAGQGYVGPAVLELLFEHERPAFNESGVVSTNTPAGRPETKVQDDDEA